MAALAGPALQVSLAPNCAWAVTARHGFDGGQLRLVWLGGIFITITPAIAIRRIGEAGAMAPLLRLVTNPDNTPNNVMYS